MRPTQPTTNASCGDAVQAPVVELGRRVSEALVERDPEPDDRELLARRDAVLDELVPHLRAHRDQDVGLSREDALDLAEERRASGAEVALQDVAVERVDDDRRPAAACGHGRGARERPGLRGVRVEDVRPLLPHDRCEPPDGLRVVQERDLALDLRDVDDVHAEPLGDVRHRVLAAREAARDEGRVVPARLEPGGEARDVDRRAAHVQPGDDAEDPYRLRHGADPRRFHDLARGRSSASVGAARAPASEWRSRGIDHLSARPSTLSRRGRALHVRRPAGRHRARVPAAGAVTLGVDADPLAPALYHCDRHVIVPRIADPAYVPTLASLVREHEVGLVVPLNDLDFPVLARARGRLAPALVLLPDAEVSARMSDKLDAHRFFVENGIASPRSWAPDEVPADARFPVLVKAREGLRLAQHLPRARRRGARVLPLVHGRPVVRAGGVPGRGVLDRRLQRHGRSLPERDPAHDAAVQGRRVDQGRLAHGSRARSSTERAWRRR